MNENEYVKFALAHWELCLAFVMVLVYWLMSEITEALNKHGISAQHLVTLINHHEAAVFDIREAEHYKKGHILGAVSHPEKDLLNNLSKLKKYHERKVVLVDATGQSSNKLINKLIAAGFKEVFFLKSGMQAWMAEKLPVNKTIQSRKESSND